jgi:hypothetical protein
MTCHLYDDPRPGCHYEIDDDCGLTGTLCSVVEAINANDE